MEENKIYARESEVQSSASSLLLRRVYTWMTLALLISGLTALKVVSSPGILSWVFSSQATFYGLLIAEVAVVLLLTWMLNRLSFLAATVMFIAYAVLNGVTCSVYFLAYTSESIASTFFITAGTFGALSLYGMFTKRDLSSIGRILFMSLIGLIIASLVNLFMRNEMIYWIISYAGVAIFVGLTAYDTQKIKQMLEVHGTEVNDATQKLALMGALTLYLDFINLFIYLLRIMGSRK